MGDAPSDQKASSAAAPVVVRKGKEVLCSAGQAQNLNKKAQKGYAWVPIAGEEEKKEPEDGVLGKRTRKKTQHADYVSEVPRTKTPKKPKVEEEPKLTEAERVKKAIQDKLKMLADVEKELAKLNAKKLEVATGSADAKKPQAPDAKKSQADVKKQAAPPAKGRTTKTTTPVKPSPRPARAASAAAAAAIAKTDDGEDEIPENDEGVLHRHPAPIAGTVTATPHTTPAITATPTQVLPPASTPATPVATPQPRQNLVPASYPAATPTAQSRVSPVPGAPGSNLKRAQRSRKMSRRFKDGTLGSAPLSYALKLCQQLLKTLMNHKYGWPFNQPVDPVALCIPDYFEIIKRPMDLGTIKEQVEAGYYETEDEFAEDIRLVFTNALTYNQPGSDICIMANTLSEIFETKLKVIKQKVAERASSVATGMEATISELRDSMRSVQEALKQIRREKGLTNGARPMHPKKEDTRPMTLEEKKRLSVAINNLPSECLGMVVKIISERMPQLVSSGEELEIDIDALNPPTLRHLERYVRQVQARRNRRRAPADAKIVQADLTEQGMQQKIEDVERRLRALNDQQQQITQKGLARSTGLPVPGSTPTTKNEDDSSSDSDSDSGSDSSGSDSSDTDSDSDSDSSETESETEKKAAAAAGAVVTPADGAAAASDAVVKTEQQALDAAAGVGTPAAGGLAAGQTAMHASGSAAPSSGISFGLGSLATKTGIDLPDLSLNGGGSSTAAVVSPTPEPTPQVSVNEAAWSDMGDEDDAGADAKTKDTDKTWSEFKTRKLQNSIREQERLEKEAKLRQERKQLDEERRLEEERRKREFEEQEMRRRRELEEASLSAQRERERLRLAAKMEREKAGNINMTEQSMLMASFEEEVVGSVAPPIMQLFQYKPLTVIDAEEDPLAPGGLHAPGAIGIDDGNGDVVDDIHGVDIDGDGIGEHGDHNGGEESLSAMDVAPDDVEEGQLTG